jgi:dipeptidyl aminopeptidase/acylaminoacyl peptidase
MNKNATRSSGILAVLMLVFTLNIDAQAQANFELAERFTAQNMTKLTGSTSVNARWIDDEDRFWYQWNGTDGKRWEFVDARRGTKQPLFDHNDMAAQLSEKFNRAFNPQDLDLRSFNYDTDRGLFTFHVDSIEFKFDVGAQLLEMGDTLKAPTREPWATYSPDSTWIAFARHHNLFVMRADDPDSTEIQLTTDGERWYSYNANHGDTTSTERIRSRAQWFEDSEKIWVKRQDFRKVDELWVINTLSNRPTLETYKYNMPGDENHYVDEIYIFDMDTHSEVKIQAEKWPDQSLGGAYFSGGGIFTTDKSDYLYILRRTRTWDEVDVVKANTTTGEVEVLWSEISKPYFNTRYAQLSIINEGEEYLWWSERTGWGQLYRYDSEGNLKNRITQGHFMVGDIMAVDTTAQTIYFQGFGREDGIHPYYAHYYKVNFDGSGMALLTPDNAHHTFSMSDSRRYFVNNFSRADMPGKSVLRNRDGRVLLELEEANINPLKEIGYKLPEIFSVKAADGVTDLYGVMWKPVDFDPNKKYPIISYVYPGPQTEPFPIGFSVGGTSGRAQSLANVGFVVVAMGNRGGNPIRHKSYHQYGHDNLRDYPLADNRYGLEQLGARHNYVDLTKVGIYGHSGGGFMSTAALLTYPDFYKVAVSSAGNHDNNVYNIYWGEVHHGVTARTRTVKEKDEDGNEVEVEKTTFTSRIPTNQALAGNLQGRLLLLHGEMDNNVHPAGTYRVADALMRAGKRFDMMIFPGMRHGFGRYNSYYERMLWSYFAEHLLGHYPTNIDFNLPD